jgi:DNA-directed RNA polymerase subunit alpha
MTKAIHNPALSEVKDLTDKSASFIIEPLEAGYGNTLGNSLRRVLLSSISGAAIVSFKVAGATHEFTTVDGIKEDVVDIALNIKNIRLKVFKDEPVELHLEKKGTGVVKASDISASADVEIINPDQIIATIDKADGVLSIDFIAETGHGYKTIEQSSTERTHSDHIALDAVFSPVLRVRYKVDNTRVGQETNLDKLTVTIETDGSITPRDAFEEAAAILVNQYTALAGSTKVEAAPALGQKNETETNELSTSIEDLGLSARTANALVNNDIHTVRDLVTLNEQDLRELKGFGSKALDEVKEKLAKLEL